MDKNEKLRILQGLNEKTLTEEYLIPLLSAGMKYKTVRYNHIILEFEILDEKSVKVINLKPIPAK